MASFIKRRFDLYRFASLGVALGIALLGASTFASSVPQQPVAGPASIHGIVRDQKAIPVVDVVLTLHSTNSTESLTTHTDSQGRYEFSTLYEGVYSLRAEMHGFNAASVSSLVVSAKESKNVDLVLVPINFTSSPNSSEPAFFDPPRFTVSGVTDTTNAGGHSSGTVVRTQQAIAKDTVSLVGKSPSATRPTVEVSAEYAERSLREQVARTPNDFESNHRLGALLVTAAKAAQAIPYLERAAQINPNDCGNAYDLALANAGNGNNARARDEAQALLRRTGLAPHDAAALHHLLAEVHEKLGDNLAAVGEYQRAAELDATEANFFDWGAELLLHHAPEPAEEVFTKGSRLFPSSERMLIGLGAARFAQDDFDQAVQKICEASDLNPNDPVPYLFLGKIETSQTVPSVKTVEALHRFVTLHSDNAEANYYYAVGLWKVKKAEESTQAIEVLLNRAVALDPSFGPAYLQRGILRASQGDDAKAIEDYQGAIQAELRTAQVRKNDTESVASELKDAHYRLAQAYRHMGDQEKAKSELALYEQAARESAQNADQDRRDVRQFVYTLRDQSSAH